MREGVRLGLIVGGATWLWVAAIDLVAGDSFFMTQSWSAVAAFTMVHFLLCMTYAVVIMSGVHASMKEPSVMFALIFCSILFEVAFVMLTAMLANLGFGQLAWGKFFGGNVMAAILTFLLVKRNHPLGELFQIAETYQD